MTQQSKFKIGDKVRFKFDSQEYAKRHGYPMEGLVAAVKGSSITPMVCFEGFNIEDDGFFEWRVGLVTDSLIETQRIQKVLGWISEGKTVLGYKKDSGASTTYLVNKKDIIHLDKSDSFMAITEDGILFDNQ